MPILELDVVVSEEESIDTTWAQQIADAAGVVFCTEPGRTWVRIRKLNHSNYAENGIELSARLRPIFATVLKAQIPPTVILRVEMGKLTKAIARITGRPAENVHILYLPPAAGRMSFGGRLVEPSSGQKEEQS